MRPFSLPAMSTSKKTVGFFIAIVLTFVDANDLVFLLTIDEDVRRKAKVDDTISEIKIK